MKDTARQDAFRIVGDARPGRWLVTCDHATNRVPADLRIEDLLHPIQLWAEAKLTLVRRFEGRGLVGAASAALQIAESITSRSPDHGSKASC